MCCCDLCCFHSLSHFFYAWDGSCEVFGDASSFFGMQRYPWPLGHLGGATAHVKRTNESMWCATVMWFWNMLVLHLFFVLCFVSECVDQGSGDVECQDSKICIGFIGYVEQPCRCHGFVKLKKDDRTCGVRLCFWSSKKAIDQFYRRYSAITTGHGRGRGGYLPQDYGIGDIKNQRAPWPRGSKDLYVCKALGQCTAETCTTGYAVLSSPPGNCAGTACTLAECCEAKLCLSNRFVCICSCPVDVVLFSPEVGTPVVYRPLSVAATIYCRNERPSPSPVDPAGAHCFTITL